MASELNLDELAAELAEEYGGNEPAVERSPIAERVLAGFEEVQRWVNEHGRPPQHGEGLDIFERLYAVRLDRIRGSETLRMTVESIDHQGLLNDGGPSGDPATMNLDELAADLEGISEVRSDLTVLKHVRSRKEIEAAEMIANRKPCAEFEQFRSVFEEVHADLKNGIRDAVPFNKDFVNNTDASIKLGDVFILSGQIAYVAEMGEHERTAVGAPQARLRVIFDNGTESNLLLRSLQAALYKDVAGRRVAIRSHDSLFGKDVDDDH
jgi:hypothetical protein